MNTFKSLKALAVAFSIVATINPAWASDHIDGPVTKKDAVADMSDLFFFKTPGVPNSLTLVLDMYPMVASNGHFSDKVNYNFILRTARRSADRSHFETDAKSEVVISCSFQTPNKNANIQATCRSNDPNHRLQGQVRFDEIATDLPGNTIQLFAGRRLDPFFLSFKFADAFMKYQKAKPDADNVLARMNCLSIIMNLKTDLLFPLLQQAAVTPTKDTKRNVAQSEEMLIAVAAESMTSDNGVPRRIDRLGRPEITNISLNMFGAELGGEIRDIYNVDPPYNVPQAKLDQYIPRLVQNIGRYDMIDQKQDWSPVQLNQLAKILTDDFLLLDPSAPCQTTNFFEIEKSLMRNQPHQSCGGRDPNDNAVNKLYTLYQRGLTNTEDVSADAQDGLTGPTVPISNQFPYLTTPDDSLMARMKRLIANLLGP